MRNFDALIDSLSAKTPEEEKLIRFCSRMNIPLTLGQKIKIKNKNYIITGMNDNNFIIIENKDKKRFIDFNIVIEEL
jgi:hypothetical protein